MDLEKNMEVFREKEQIRRAEDEVKTSWWSRLAMVMEKVNPRPLGEKGSAAVEVSFSILLLRFVRFNFRGTKCHKLSYLPSL